MLLFVNTAVFAQLPNNIGFEKGNFDGWESSIGQRYRDGTDIMDPPTSSPYPYPDRFMVYGQGSKYETDEFGGFPILCPNGSKYSIKMGHKTALGKMQRVTYTFDIPTNISTYSIIFNYAVVLENPSHGVDEQPLFSARIYDVTDGKYISCPAFDFAASSALPGFKLSDNAGPRASVYYKDWSTAMINLNDYAGKKIRIEFTSQDCKPNGHFGYAYLDIDEELSLRPISGNVFCSNQTVTTLTGPTGFENYTWYKDNDFTKPGISGQSITVPAIDKDKYALHLTPYFGLGCVDTLYINLQKLPEPFNLVVAPKVYGCQAEGFNLKDASVTTGSSLMKFSYYKDPFGLEYLPNPDRVSQSGVYYIRGTNDGGCTDILPVEVVLTTPDFTVTQPLPVRYPTKVDLSATHNHAPGNTFTYYSDAAAITPMVDFSVNVSGTYYVKATSDIGCSVTLSVNVVVNPPPAYTIEASNTFTPNGDGINDEFFIKTTGYVTMTLLQIFNRYGQLVFTTRSINDKWTGNNGSSALPEGTYYWIFDGTDDYFHTKMKKASSITIVR